MIQIKIILTLVLAVFVGTLFYLLDSKNKKIEQLKTARTVIKAKHKAKLFENKQEIIFKKEKEVTDEEVPGSIGVHTVVFD